MYWQKRFQRDNPNKELEEKAWKLLPLPEKAVSIAHIKDGLEKWLRTDYGDVLIRKSHTRRLRLIHAKWIFHFAIKSNF
ncbi:hypothetical protein F310043J5_14190 [Anaerostipes hominis (ex Lee et al. 2021)]